MAKITVIINCAYGAEYLRQALDSVFAQTFQDWEILFIDNASEDGCTEIARGYEASGKLRYFRISERVPVCAARNYALDRAQGSYVAFLDADDLFVPEALQRLYEKMTPGRTFVYSGYRYVDEAARPLARWIQGRFRGNIVNRLLLRSFVAITGTLISRQAIGDMRFDTQYELIYDYDMWIRLAQKDQGCDFAEGYLSLIRVHGNNASIRQRNRWILEERKFYRGFIARHGVFRYPMIAVYVLKYEYSHLIGRDRLRLRRA